MKILMLAMSMGLGGAETHVLELSRGLARLGHTVFVASNGGTFVGELERGGVRHIFAPLHSKNPAHVAKSLAVLSRLCERERFDIVHAHARIPAVIASLLKRRFGFVFVTTAHGVYDAECACARVMDWGEHIFAVSEDIAEKLAREYAYPRERITLVPNGIDTARFCPDVSGEEVRAHLGLAGKRVVMYLGRLSHDSFLPAKALLESAEALFCEHRDIKIVLVGEGEKRAELSARAREVNSRLGEEIVLLPGGTSRAEAYIAACDVFVAPSRSAMEALACGKPTVVAGNAGTLGLFGAEVAEAARRTNFCCRGFAPTTAENVKTAVLHALSLSESERKAAAEYGRAFVCEHYSVRKMAAIYEKNYAKLLATRGKRVLLCGYYGYGNVGDEAMLSVLCRALAGSEAVGEICVMSTRPDDTAKRRDTLAVPRFSPAAVGKAMARADVLIFGGGNIFQDRTSTASLLYYAAVARLARAHGCRVALSANGIGPLLHRKNLTRVKKALSAADYISMREDFSRELAVWLTESEDVFLSGDLVFAGERAEKALFLGEKYYAVFPKEVSAREEGELLRFFCAMRRQYGLIPVFAALHGREDEKICRKFAARLPWTRYEASVRDAPRARALAKGAQFTLSMRLHGAVFAVAEACPVIAVSRDAKAAAFFATARLRGCAIFRGVRAKDLVASAGEILKNRKKIAAHLGKAAAREKAKAEAEIERLRLFLSL
ncbi:MAG: polysaccharide pyruvyl transferase family protein [Clostridia bacterium]|nr:polysaccharide pyruvyl transferase family protein [Clostridia bacterium]